MTVNSLYPGFIHIDYVSNGHSHRQTLPVKPFAVVGGGWGVEKPISPAQYVNWEDAVTAWVTIVKALFHSTSTFVAASLWTLADATADPLFRAEFALGVAGVSSAVTTPNSLLSQAYRTDAGGLLKIAFVESSVTVNQVGQPPTFTGLTAPGAATVVALSTFLRGADNFVFGRDGGRPIAALRAFTKTSDALRKKFVLDA